MQRDQVARKVGAGEVFVECIEHTGFSDFGYFLQRDNPTLRARKTLPGGKCVSRKCVSLDKNRTGRIEGRGLGVYWPHAGCQNGNPGFNEGAANVMRDMNAGGHRVMAMTRTNRTAITVSIWVLLGGFCANVPHR
jgi:hypothetical protein